jgi:hypothetical protein
VKIIFIITDAVYIRSFVNTGIIKELSKYHKITLLLREGIDFAEIKKNSLDFEIYQIDLNSKSKTNYFDILITNLKHKSKYFPFRLKRLYRFDLRFLNELCLRNKIKANFLNKFKYFYIIFINWLKYCYYFFLSRDVIFNILNKLSFFDYPINKDLELKINKILPDKIIIPSSGYSPEIYDLNFLSIKKNIKYQVIVDNWDNLSSKMIFQKSPDKVYVWGEQTALHANKIHGIPKNKIIKIGCARYLNYFFQRNNNSLINYFNCKYVLFLGSSWSWNEEQSLEELDIIINKNFKIFDNLKIIYRPHPFRQRDTDFKKKYKNIIYDPQILQFCKNKKSWPDLEYYPGLLKNTLFCIGGLTSMLIESTIFYKKYLAIGYDDNESLMNQKNALKNFEHLEQIENLPNVSIIHRKKDLEDKFIQTYINFADVLKKEIDEKREFFLHKPVHSISDIILKNLN